MNPVRMACSFLIAAVLIAAASVTHAANRIALVIGNAAYKNVPSLRNSVNDANAVGEALRNIGFEVLLARNVDRVGMNGSISQFMESIEPGTEAVVYFAGHGVELSGSNYLLPTDIPRLAAGQERLLRSEAVSLSDILTDLQSRSARVLVVILDACRENPFKAAGVRSAVGAARGLARVDPPSGTFVIFSAGAGELALDSLGLNDPNPNSVFTRNLLRLLSEDGLELRDAVRKLRSEVRLTALKAEGHRQFPSYYDQLDGEFYFRPKAPDAQSLTAEPAANNHGIVPSIPDPPRQSIPDRSRSEAERSKKPKSLARLEPATVTPVVPTQLGRKPSISIPLQRKKAVPRLEKPVTRPKARGGAYGSCSAHPPSLRWYCISELSPMTAVPACDGKPRLCYNCPGRRFKKSLCAAPSYVSNYGRR